MSRLIVNSQQRKWYFAQKNGNSRKISEDFFKDSESAIKPRTGIKKTPSWIKIAKEKKITNTVGVNVGIIHFAHSVEKTFSAE